MRSTIALSFMALGLAAAYPAENVPSEVSVLPELSALPTAGSNATSTVPESSPTTAPALKARQDIDFDLVDSTPDPSVGPDDSTNYDPTSALSSVIAEISNYPLEQRRKRNLQRRDILVSTTAGYTNNVFLNDSAINAPLDCNKVDTYLGAKIFTSGPFDTNLCAAACSAQSAYNLRHPPSTGKPKTCQFYNTYTMYKNGVYQGQYCSMYTESWAASYATNKGQYRGTDLYTVSDSYMASNATNTGEVSCPSDIPYLSASGADFCTSYISYIPPTVLTTVTTTPATATVSYATTIPTTVTTYSTNWATTQVTVTVTAGALKRDLQVRSGSIPTPASASTWSPSRISAACSAVATGDVTNTITQTAATPFVTLVETTIASVFQTIPVAMTATVTKTVTVSPTPSGLIKYNIGNGDYSGWQITVSNTAYGVRNVTDKQYSETGTTNDAEGFIFPDGAPSSSTIFWYQQWTAIPNQIYEIAVDFQYQNAANVYDNVHRCIFYLGGRSGGVSSYSIVQNAPGYQITQQLNNVGYTSVCGGTKKAGAIPNPGEWIRLKAWIQPQAAITSVELQGTCGGPNLIKWGSLTVNPISC